MQDTCAYHLEKQTELVTLRKSDSQLVVGEVFRLYWCVVQVKKSLNDREFWDEETIDLEVYFSRTY